MPSATSTTPFEPRWPLASATGLLSLWIMVLSLPMWTGAFLAGPFSDQYATGYAYRRWAAEQWKALGHVPLWNPEIFGGLPFVAAMHGDIFYPTAWLRLLLPTVTAMNLGFVVHYVLAGLFLYALLRLLGTSWVGAVVGGTAYQLSGVVASYVQPGHDGKTFVTALFPLALIGLVLAFRNRRLEGHAVLALAVGLGILSPHPQMLYYMLVAAGIFALYLAFGEPDTRDWRRGSVDLTLALLAVVLGFGIGMIQILPFFQYIPFSPRAEGYYGFEGATSFAIPWSHVPEFVMSAFVGSRDSYWGPNPLKLHSEYLGLPVVALAVLGALRRDRRNLIIWLGAIGLLFLLVSLGAGTPFYRVWWSVMPFMDKVRAPGMALYLVAFVTAMYAAFGAERLLRRRGEKQGTIWLIVGGILAVLAVIGVIPSIAGAIAEATSSQLGRPPAVPDVSSVRAGALASGVALLGLGGLAVIWRMGRVSVSVFSITLILLVGGDLWWSARGFWTFSDVHETLHRPDQVTERLMTTSLPYRVLDLGVYPGAALMAQGIPQLLGHHGNELHRFDELLGGKNQWRNAFQPVIWDLYAIKYLIVPAGIDGVEQIPGYRPILEVDSTAAGVGALLLERTSEARYARLIPAAIRAPDEQAIPTILSPRFVPDRVVLLAPDAPHEPAPVSSLPAAIDGGVSVTSWAPGRMTIRLARTAPADSYLLIAENWYPDWHARVDGESQPVLRSNYALMTVPVPSGAREIELTFDSANYRLGKGMTLIATVIALLGVALPPVIRRRRRG